MTVRTICLGFPRIGAGRELKGALEGYWSGRLARSELLQVGRELRLRHWRLQREAGIDEIPCNDFSLYDQMLDMACLLGCIPSRCGCSADRVDLDTYFVMARGSATATAMEMTKWFDANYHYLVPEFEPQQSFRIASGKLFDEYTEAKAQGISTVPVLVGPLSFALLGKAKYREFSLSDTIARLLPVYTQILQRLQQLGASVQIDEPCLVTDLSAEAAGCARSIYRHFAVQIPQLKIRLASYFGALGDNAELAFSLPVAALHVDIARAPEQLDRCLDLAASRDTTLVLGLVDGRNIWRSDLRVSLAIVDKAVARLGSERVAIAPSCSLLHVPIDLAQERHLDAAVHEWLAFAQQKLVELKLLKHGANHGHAAIAQQLSASDTVRARRSASTRIHDPRVKQRLASLDDSQRSRQHAFAERARRQRGVFALPLFPTTTIGSFPQTAPLRAARAARASGQLAQAAYDHAIEQEIEHVIRMQERIGLDVLVHGEAERNDMVQYFGEQLRGCVVTDAGWVQSYGSRCVKPPIIFGDVSRPQPMTVRWSSYAQSLTDRIVKAMLTGPVTMLQWSFVRDDQPRSETCRQIALAIRDEVTDLERAGLRMIQIDEPAIREGLPLRRRQWPQYLRWAVEAFQLAASSVRDETQIHSHMCYSEFNDIIEAIAAMDADVISVETSRSQLELLQAFGRFRYPNEIGPGVYDIHSPRVPQVDEMLSLLRKARTVLAAEQIWVNPDCGLKTRGWPEVELALRNMVEAARLARQEAAAPILTAP